MATIIDEINKCNSIETLLKVIVELKAQKRSLVKSKNHLKWMDPFHRPFHDNSNQVEANRNYIQKNIDTANCRIQILKLNPIPCQ